MPRLYGRRTYMNEETGTFIGFRQNSGLHCCVPEGRVESLILHRGAVGKRTLTTTPARTEDHA